MEETQVYEQAEALLAKSATATVRYREEYTGVEKTGTTNGQVSHSYLILEGDPAIYVAPEDVLEITPN